MYGLSRSDPEVEDVSQNAAEPGVRSSLNLVVYMHVRKTEALGSQECKKGGSQCFERCRMPAKSSIARDHMDVSEMNGWVQGQRMWSVRLCFERWMVVMSDIALATSMRQR
jgi:hypothetical protein